jgi:beta-N-acetylhexosaminidase
MTAQLRRRSHGSGRRWALLVAVWLAAVVGVAAVVLSGAASGRHAPARAAAAPSTALHPLTPPRVAAAPSAALPPLTPAQMAGQRVIYSYTGPTPPSELLWLIRHGRAAGVIFFADNIRSRVQLRAAVRALELADQSSGNPIRAPLLLMTDQEGGQVRRLSGAPLLSEKQIGLASDPAAAATAAGTGAAANLRGVGLNVDLAPVLDVYRTAGDFDDQFGRSYSRQPAVVSALGADFITALQKGGVAATAKHFPGLGAATRAQDTDTAPVTLGLTAGRIRGFDEVPYKAAIDARVKLVMVSWATYPALEPGRPAGLAAAVVQGELRTRLGFAGVTVTDALEAGALRPFGTIGHRAELAAGAGMDLILCSQGQVGEGEQALAGLRRGYVGGALGKSGFEAAVERIVALRESF